MKRLVTLLLLVVIWMPKATVFAEEAAPASKRIAVLVGNGTYRGTPEIPGLVMKNLKGPYNDVDKLEMMFLVQNFETEVRKYKDLSESEILAAIEETYSAAPEDQLFFSFAGHGYYDSAQNMSYIVGADGKFLSVDELEAALSKFPGKVTVFLDSCNSGGFIDPHIGELDPQGMTQELWSLAETEWSNGDENGEWTEDLVYPSAGSDPFVDRMVSAFSYAPRAALIGDKYHVLVASTKEGVTREAGFGPGWGWGGEVTRSFVRGNGYMGVFLADADQDQSVNWSELVKFCKKNVRMSTVGAHPEADDAVVVGQAKIGSGPNEKVRYEVPITKEWTIRFNLPVRASEAESFLSMTTFGSSSLLVEVPIEVRQGSDEKTLLVRGRELMQDAFYYKLILKKGLKAADGAELPKEEFLHFFTAKESRKNEALNLVQNSHPEGYPQRTWKEALDKKTRNPSWRYFITIDKEDAVESTGQIQLRGEWVTLKLQFLVDLREGSHKLSYAGADGRPLTAEELKSLLIYLFVED